MAEREPYRKIRDEQLAKQRIETASTIALLQQRVVERFEDIELPGGDRIPVRTSMSEADRMRLDELRKEYVGIRSLTTEETTRVEALESELITLRMVTPDAIRRVREITAELDRIRGLTDEELDRIREMDYEIVEIITADTSLTAAWLRENPDAFSHEDLSWIITGFRAQQIRHTREREERIEKARTFRLQQ